MPTKGQCATIRSTYPAWTANYAPPRAGDPRGETSYRIGSCCPTCKPQTEWTRRHVLVCRIWRHECCGREVM